MSKPAVFTQTDISRVLKGARAADVKLDRVEIDRNGKIVLQIARTDGLERGDFNEWDEVTK
jgi:glucose-6-phosphate isomerase